MTAEYSASTGKSDGNQIFKPIRTKSKKFKDKPQLISYLSGTKGLKLVLQTLKFKSTRTEGASQFTQEHHIRAELVESVAEFFGGRRSRICGW